MSDTDNCVLIYDTYLINLIIFPVLFLLFVYFMKQLIASVHMA